MSFFPWLSSDSALRQEIVVRDRKIAELQNTNAELRKKVARYQGQIIAAAQAIEAAASALYPEDRK